MRELRVGIIGVNVRGGWAAEAHVPAVRAVDGLELVAVATSGQDTADAAAAKFGVGRGYGDAQAMIASPDIDVVTVAAPVPAHRDLIAAALDAGKHVLTEWPVALGTAPTADLADRADRSAGRLFVGLQARTNPAVRRLRELLAEGAIGRALGVTVQSATAGWGPVVPGGAAALEDPATGMNLLTIQTAHTLDLVGIVAGPYESLSALTTVQYPEVEVGDRRRRRVVPDHVLVQARLAGGGWAAVQVSGGRPADDCPFRLDLVGIQGVLSLVGGTPRGFQAGRLSLLRDGHPLATPDPLTDASADPVVNVAGLYAALLADIGDGGGRAPSGPDGLGLARLLDLVGMAAGQGRTVDVPPAAGGGSGRGEAVVTPAR